MIKCSVLGVRQLNRIHFRANCRHGKVHLGIDALWTCVQIETVHLDTFAALPADAVTELEKYSAKAQELTIAKAKSNGLSLRSSATLRCIPPMEM